MFKLALGAGHGLNTPGKRCLKSLDPNETREWELNDRICDYVEQGLKEYTGVSVLRLDDSNDGADDVALESRVKAANKWGADFYLSVHHNAGASGGTAGGIMAFSLSNTGEGSKWRNDLYAALIKHTGLKGNRANPKATGNYYVLRATDAPAVLLELGFMDSRKDVPVILTDDYARKCAKAIVEVIVARAKLSKAKTSVKLQRYGVKLTDIEHMAYIPMDGNSGETVTEAARRTKWNNRTPDMICNAELYNMKTFAPASGVVHDGKAQLLSPVLGLAIVDNKPVLSYQNNVKAKDWLGAYPCLVRDGKIAFDKPASGQTGKHAWTAAAWNETTFTMFYVREEDKCTLKDFATAILDAGYTTAINFDGGGSTAVITPLVAYDQGRKVRGKLGVWIKGGYGNKAAQGRQVRVNISALNIRSGPGTKHKIVGVAKQGQAYTIVDEKNGWGEIDTGGWIKLSYTR